MKDEKIFNEELNGGCNCEAAETTQGGVIGTLRQS